MEIINNLISHELKINEYFDTDNISFMDIETTGFSRKNDIIYLVGILQFNSKNKIWHLQQFFANNINKEEKLLKDLLPIISSFDKVITYNGDAFDIPFIEDRMKYNNIDYVFDKSKSFDIYRMIRNDKQYLDLPNLRLKTIEESLGFHREDIYSGRDCIKFYYDYIKSGNKSKKDLVLKHNYDDLIHMLDIISILDVLDDKKSVYFGINDAEKFTISNLELSGDMLIIKGVINNKLKRNVKYYDNHISISSKRYKHIHISIELNRGYISKNEQCLYIDVSNISYLNDILDLTEYTLPPNIVVLAIEKQYVLTNIKSLLVKLLENIM